MSRENTLKKQKSNSLLLLVPISIIAFSAVVMSFVSTIALSYLVAPVAMVMFLEVVLGFLLHDAEFWLHGVIATIQFVAAILCWKELLIICCLVTYITTVLALHISRQGATE
ncbi:hypothetical protein [Lachnobacterium bovis]|uniref:Uncharacterized protein n=1 Tax=Lachnobacterium bovis TaxID=140626 RepID=A0A1H9PVI6_9FIRM|nr:hypothetical protein [Lachnobacterium bovis]SER52182.1 hypothetical protein SAMN02910429_00327 [Lachnobacterium bovis]